MAVHDIESVEVDRQSHVEVIFADGVRARFDLRMLRLACPCATCSTNRSRNIPVAPFIDRGDPLTIAGAELAGAWGLNIDWSDGHATGIYSWEKLREWVDAGRATMVDVP